MMKTINLKALFLFIVAGALTLVFQNCSPSSLNSLDIVNQKSTDLNSVYDPAGTEEISDTSEVTDNEQVPANPKEVAEEPAYDYRDFSCPAGFIKVPPLGPYAYRGFCVAKFEMKSDRGAKSQAQGSPWVYVSRTQAISACRSLGERYDLISNSQWQAVARNVASVASNWGTAEGGPNSSSAYSGELSRGVHFKPSQHYGESASENDSEGCVNTGKICSETQWSAYRRTHLLSNGEVVWDMAGNVFEWVKDDIEPGQKDSWIARILNTDIHSKNFGAAEVCNSPSAESACGYGNGWLAGARQGLGARRGGYWFGIYAGIFTTSLGINPEYSHMGTGFRCSYLPE